MAAVILLAAISCGKNSRLVSPSNRESAIREVERLEAPEGVNPEILNLLKSELVRQLEARSDGRIASALPAGDSATVTDLIFNSQSNQMEWTYTNPGDYDANGEVGVADITPIALNFGAVTNDGAGDDAYESWIDGDGNGEVGVSDITPIALNFLGQISGYYLLNGPSQTGPWTTVQTITLDQRLQGYPVRFQGFGTTFPEAYFAVVAFDADDNRGEISNVVAYSGNALPSAVLNADSLSGPAPLTVNFDSSGSTDSDGVIERFEWDFEGDGIFDLDTGADPSAMHVYTAQGSFFATVRVVDNFGGSDTDSIWINVSAEGNEPPVAALTADYYQGKTPLLVTFDASSSTDSDGTIASFQWDFDGDGTFDEDTGTTPAASNNYTLAGTYFPAVKVTDDGGASDTFSIEITVSENQYPSGAFVVNPVAGNPWAFEFDASASSDPDGNIVSFQWDWESDGNFDYDGGGDSMASHIFSGNGHYNVTLRVTDDNGASADTTHEVTVDVPPLIWNKTEPYILPFGQGVLSSPSLAIIEGTYGPVPAIAYNEYNQFVGDAIYYVSASDSTGVSWNPPAFVLLEKGASIDLLEVNGRPAIAWESISNHLTFLRADDLDGLTWSGTPWVSDVFGSGRFASMAISGAGNPVIASYSWFDKLPYFSRATDPDGTTWASDIELESVADNGKHISLAILEGWPSVAYYDYANGDLKYASAVETDGSAWNEPLTAYSDGDVGSYCTMTTIYPESGPPMPAIACLDYANLRIMFITAADRSGSTWNPPVTIESEFPSGPMALGLVGGKPAIAYTANIGASTPQLCYKYALDFEGTAWSARQQVHLGYCESINLVDIDGHPAVSFIDNTADPTKLYYAYSPGTE